MIRRGWGVGAAVVAAAVLVTGCSGDPEQVATPSPTPTETVDESPSPTPTPSATALTEEEILAAIPEAARTEDLNGAFVFAATFIRESRAMFVEQESALFAAMSGPECTFCESNLDYLESLTANSQQLQDGQIDVVSDVPRGGLQSDGSWQLEFEIDVAATTIVDQSGAVVDTAPAQSYTVAVALARTGDAWEVIDVGSEAA